MEHKPPKSVRIVMEESNRVGVQFLLTDMAAAVTFLNVADATQSEDSRQRNRQNALSAYQTVLRLLPKLTPSDEERCLVVEKLTELKNRLIAVGVLTPSEEI